jgi:hypothetical protein
MWFEISTDREEARAGAMAPCAVRSNGGQSVVKVWSKSGQSVVKEWPNNGQNARAQVEDHNPPLLGQMVHFLRRASAFMEVLFDHCLTTV